MSKAFNYAYDVTYKDSVVVPRKDWPLGGQSILNNSWVLGAVVRVAADQTHPRLLLLAAPDRTWIKLSDTPHGVVVTGASSLLRLLGLNHNDTVDESTVSELTDGYAHAGVRLMNMLSGNKTPF